MPASTLKLPYARPASLSDPYGDHTSEHCSRLIATPDAQLTWHDFQCILGPYLPAGTYEESAYFLPLAFGHIREDDENALDLVTSLIGFTSKFSEELRRDGAFEAVRSQVTYCLDHWTSSFIVHHQLLDSVGDSGRSGDYLDRVRNSDVVMKATKDLVQFRAHEDLAVSFFAHLAGAKNDPVKSAWFLECVRAYASKDISRPPEHPEIQQLLYDEQLGIRHSQTIRQRLPTYDASLPYWQDTFALLGTIGDV